MIAIDNPDDPRLEPYRSVRERDLRGRQGRFILEGEVVLRAALDGPMALESVLLHPRHADLAAAVPPGVPVYAAERAVLDAVAGFPLHRGILAVGLRGPEPAAADLLDALLHASPGSATVLVLAGLANHDNVGACFRNAAAFGVGAVLLDQGSCDPLYRKSIRVSAGAATRIPFARGGTTEALCAALAARGFAILATSPRGTVALEDLAAADLETAQPGSRVAVLLGAEGTGLPETLLAALRSVRIAMAPEFDSLNVATAGAIVLHHLATRVHPGISSL